ncbi:hypothetical protein DFH09DRAFT_1390367 [Mycena vulgaris]|nr:hypothetical protein DFH09DRAFT_1390367 [Mycena vulgaris]
MPPRALVARCASNSPTVVRLVQHCSLAHATQLHTSRHTLIPGTSVGGSSNTRTNNAGSRSIILAVYVHDDSPPPPSSHQPRQTPYTQALHCAHDEDALPVLAPMQLQPPRELPAVRINLATNYDTELMGTHMTVWIDKELQCNVDGCGRAGTCKSEGPAEQALAAQRQGREDARTRGREEHERGAVITFGRVLVLQGHRSRRRGVPRLHLRYDGVPARDGRCRGRLRRLVRRSPEAGSVDLRAACTAKGDMKVQLRLHCCGSVRGMPSWDCTNSTDRTVGKAAIAHLWQAQEVDGEEKKKKRQQRRRTMANFSGNSLNPAAATSEEYSVKGPRTRGMTDRLRATQSRWRRTARTRLATGDWYANTAAPYDSDTGGASIALLREVSIGGSRLRVQQHGVDGLESGFYERRRLGWRVVHAAVGPEERLRKVEKEDNSARYPVPR